MNAIAPLWRRALARCRAELMRVGALGFAGLVLPAQAASDASDAHAAPVAVSCSAGPFALQLPPSYAALREIGPLKGEQIRLVDERPGLDAPLRIYRNSLQFDGLDLEAVTATAYPDRYRILGADIRSARWQVAGPLRVGLPLAALRRQLRAHGLHLDAEGILAGRNDDFRLTTRRGRIARIQVRCKCHWSDICSAN